MIGEIFALFAAALWSLHMIFAKKAQSKNAQSANPIAPMVGVFVTIFVNNVINLLVLAVRYAFWDPVPINMMGVLVLCIAGVFNSFVGRGLLFACVAILGAARTGLTRAAMPVFVLVGGVFVLGERLSPQAWFGIGIVLLGLFLMSFDTARKDKKKSAGAAQLDAMQERADQIRLLKGIALGVTAAMIMGSGNV
ncbi:MAG: DMT family transporter, partial [Treponema sp.]|nr:DMT family transporter [Treponema sp.]